MIDDFRYIALSIHHCFPVPKPNLTQNHRTQETESQAFVYIKVLGEGIPRKGLLRNSPRRREKPRNCHVCSKPERMEKYIKWHDQKGNSMSSSPGVRHHSTIVHNHPKTFYLFFFSFFLKRSRVSNIQHQDVRRPILRKLVHDVGNLLLLNHRADGNPVRFLERGDCRRTLARSDFAGSGKEVAWDVVLTEDVFLGR